MQQQQKEATTTKSASALIAAASHGCRPSKCGGIFELAATTISTTAIEEITSHACRRYGQSSHGALHSASVPQVRNETARLRVDKAVIVTCAATCCATCEHRQAAEAEPCVAIATNHLVALCALRLLTAQVLLCHTHLTPRTLARACTLHPIAERCLLVDCSCIVAARAAAHAGSRSMFLACPAAVVGRGVAQQAMLLPTL